MVAHEAIAGVSDRLVIPRLILAVSKRGVDQMLPPLAAVYYLVELFEIPARADPSDHLGQHFCVRRYSRQVFKFAGMGFEIKQLRWVASQYTSL